MRKRFVVLGACLAVFTPFGAAVSAAESCSSLYDEINSAGENLTADQLKAYYRRSLETGDCTDAFKKALGRRVAVAVVRAVDETIASGQPAASQEAALEESLTFHRLWQVLAVLGDIAHERQDFNSAARRYQQSLETLADRELTKSEPSGSTISALFKKAETSRLLAPRYVPAPTNSAGALSGLAAANLRGFVPAKVAVPVIFTPNTPKIAAEGRRTVAAMINALTQQGSPDVLLVGHTASLVADPDSELLSEQRAHAVRQVMMDAGYGGAVQVQGLGARQPFDPDTSSRYTKEQRDQMNSRMELHR